MSVIASTPPPDAVGLTVEQYHQMIEAGILAPEDRVELLEGWLVRKVSQNPSHVAAAGLAAAALVALALPGVCVRSDKPITLDDSEPEPDVVVARGSIRDFIRRHPGVADIELAIEVADTSLPQDRRLKYRIFARSGIRVYWIINLVDRQIEVYQGPSGATAEPNYVSRRDYFPGEKVPVIVSGDEVGQIAVADLLP